MKCNYDNLYATQSYHPTKNHHAKSKGHQVNVPVIVPMDIIGYTFTSYTSYFSFHSPFTTIRCITLTMTVIRYQILEIRNQVRLVIYGISLPKYLTNYTIYHRIYVFVVCYCLGIESDGANISESPVESTENMRHKRNVQHLEGFANEPLLDSDSMR